MVNILFNLSDIELELTYVLFTGTTIITRNLFKNLPVRKHYYSSAKRRREELKKVEDLVFAFTLAVPGVHLTLSHDK